MNEINGETGGKKLNEDIEKRGDIENAQNRADGAVVKAERNGLVSVARVAAKALNGLKSGVAMANDIFWSWRNNRMTKKLGSKLGEREATMEKLRPLLSRLDEIERKKKELTQYVEKLEEEGSPQLKKQEFELKEQKDGMKKAFLDNNIIIKKYLAEEHIDSPLEQVEELKILLNKRNELIEEYPRVLARIEENKKAQEAFLKSEPVRVDGEKATLNSEKGKIGKRKDKKKWEGEIGAYDEVIGKIKAKKGKIWDNMSEKGREKLRTKLAEGASGMNETLEKIEKVNELTEEFAKERQEIHEKLAKLALVVKNEGGEFSKGGVSAAKNEMEKLKKRRLEIDKKFEGLEPSESEFEDFEPKMEKYEHIQRKGIGSEDKHRGTGLWSKFKSAWSQARGSKDQVRDENGLNGHQSEEALNALYENSVPAERKQENGTDVFSDVPVFDDEKGISWKTELNSEDAKVVAKKIKKTIEEAMKGSEEEQKKKLGVILNWLEEKLKEANKQVNDNSEKRKEIFQEAIKIVENLKNQI